MTNPSNKKVYYPIPSLCECGCNIITWNGKKYIHGHNNHNKYTEEYLVKEFMKYYVSDRRITRNDISSSLRSKIIIKFGSYNKFLKYLGLLTYNSNEKFYDYDEKPTIHLGYIIGVALGDAHLSMKHINLTVTDKDFIEYFAYCLKSIGFEPKIYYDSILKSGKQRNQHRCVVNNKKLCTFLRSICNVNWCKSQSKDIQLYILKGLWDSEGCIQLNKTISFSNTKLEIAELYSYLLLNVIDIPSHNHKGISKLGNYEVICYHIYFGKKLYRKIFMDTVGVTIGRKRERLERFI